MENGTSPDVIVGRRTITNDSTTEESVETQQDRIKWFDIFKDYLYERLLKTVPDSFIPEMEKLDDGLAAWAKLLVHLTSVDHNFISSCKDRLQFMKLIHFHNNMRIFLTSFKEDLDLLTGFETFSSTTILKMLRKAQAVDENNEWNSKDPYHEVFSTLYTKLIHHNGILAFATMEKYLIGHYDLLYKNKVENIHTKGAPEPSGTNALAANANASFSAKAFITEALKNPDLSNNQRKKLMKEKALLTGKGGGRPHADFKRDKGKGKGRGRGRGRGKGGRGNPNFKKGVYCDNCGLEGHIKKTCYKPGGDAHKPRNQDTTDQSNATEHVFLMQHLEEALSTSTTDNAYDNEYIYIDTCCTGHMTGSDNDITEKKKTTGHVKFGDPLAKASITHTCVKKFSALDQDGKTPRKITLSRTLFVEGLTKDLVSVFELFSKGIELQLKKGNMRLILPASKSGEQKIYIPLVWHKKLLAVKKSDLPQ